MLARLRWTAQDGRTTNVRQNSCYCYVTLVLLVHQFFSPPFTLEYMSLIEMSVILKKMANVKVQEATSV